jgi:short-subunit dehydrogenase
LLIETNVIGALNAVHPLLERMLARRRGQIAIMSSTAAFDPAPDLPSYSASKSALLSYGLALRAAAGAQGVRVSVICPGYIDTPMTGQISGPKPFTISAAAAAERIHRGLEQDRPVIAFPWLFALMSRLAGLLPFRVRHRVPAVVRFIAPPKEDGMHDRLREPESAPRSRRRKATTRPKRKAR